MERLTTNKKVSEMGMVELAHNCSYVDAERNTRYRDFEMEMDARDFARNLWAMADLREKLKCYEDAEEQGLLLKLPCKVGDIVWEINAERKIISKFVIESITIYPCNVIQFKWTLLEGICKNVVGFSETELGITVFLTREEAEAKLKEMEGRANGNF